MLHRNVLMADIDVDQWRNAQSLLLRSAKAARRIVVIHEDGVLRKLAHTTGAPIAGHVETVADPRSVARSLYEANQATTDFVLVFERDAVDSYFAQIQDGWNVEDDLDVFVQRTYAAIDDYPDGMVTYPEPARSRLGLQWRTGSSLEQVVRAARALVRPGTTAVLGVHDDGRLWTSLVLDFDDEWEITSITTADPSLVDIVGEREAVLDRLTAHCESSGKTVSLAISFERGAVERFLGTGHEDKASLFRDLLQEDKVSVGRIPVATAAD